MPPPPIISAATPRSGVSDIPENTQYPTAPSTTTATDLYDTAVHPCYTSSQHDVPSMTDAFFCTPRAVLFDDELHPPPSSFATQQAMPIDPALLDDVDSGDGTILTGSNFLPGSMILMEEDAEGELLEWPD